MNLDEIINMAENCVADLSLSVLSECTRMGKNMKRLQKGGNISANLSYHLRAYSVTILSCV
jgi:hypothetical protein